MVRILLLFTAIFHFCSASYFIAAPNLLRVGVEETVSITVFDADQNVKLYLHDYPHRKKKFSQVEGNFFKGQPGQLTVKVKATDLPDQKSLDKQYVYLVAKSASFHDEIPILVSYRNSMVFVHTDKPIYTPGQTVHIRVIPLDLDLKASIKNVTLDLMNPQGIRVRRWRDINTEKGFMSKRKILEETAFLGNWTVSALYGHGGVQNASVQFEVKEYVLPTFSVKIEGPPFILEDDKDIHIIVRSKYTYGKPVKGSVQLSLAVLDVGGKTTRFSTTFPMLIDGKAEDFVDIDLIKKHPDIIRFPYGKRLFIEAKVTEKATGKQETALRNTFYFTKSPYKISFKRSSKFFKPAVPFEVKVDVTYMDGKPAQRVDLKVDAKTNTGIDLPRRHGAGQGQNNEKTDEHGYASFILDVPRDFTISHLNINVSTDTKPSSSHVFQPTMYTSPGNNYLFVRCPRGKVGESVDAEAFIVITNLKPSSLSYLVSARGKIVTQGSINRNVGVLTTITLDVKSSMSPRARLVVYYMVGGEIVTDSTVIEVEEAFPNNVQFITNGHGGLPVAQNVETKQPSEAYDIRIKGDPFSRIGILAVDQSVYLLRKNEQLTSRTVFDRVTTHDLGCGWGGGQNNKDVLTKAGLAVMTGYNLETTRRDNYHCGVGNRRKRSLTANDLKLCCLAGEVPSTGSCLERGQNFSKSGKDSECIIKYYLCCQAKKATRGRSGNDDVPAELLNVQDFDLTTEDLEELLEDIQVRTEFPETWLYEDKKAGKDGIVNFQASVPDTITTWVMQAIAISNTTGFGLTPPFYLKCFIRFFVSLSLPYSAQRGEQVSVLATIYNYQDRSDKIYVTVLPNKDMCSVTASNNGRPTYQKYDIGANDAISISFPVVPLVVGQIPIQVAAQTATIGSDVVRRDLKVVPEGKQRRKTHSIVLDPQNILEDPNAPKPVKPTTSSIIKTGLKGKGEQQNSIKLDTPESTVPHSESAKLHLLGNLIGPVVSNIIEGRGLDKFIQLPTGCGEQTMLKLGPVVYVMQYLRETKQVTPQIEERAFQYIQSGYQHELTYRRKDGSFSAFGNSRPGSTWLTAFVMKTFCAAQKFGGLDIDQNVICDAMNYISALQRNDGAIPEPHPVIHQEMNGDITSDITMTAYAVTAFLECNCPTIKSTNTIKNAVGYLERMQPNIKRAYVKAVVAYALTLANSRQRFAANRDLMLDAIYDPDKKTRHWAENGNAVSVETTSYGVLTQMLLKRIGYSGPLIVWLTEQRKGGGGFVSTQDTCVALQALAAYSEATDGNHLDLLVEITSSTDNEYRQTLYVDKTNALVQQQVDVTSFLGGDIFIKTTGSGVAQLQVEIIYNTPLTEKESCQFEVTVTTMEKQKAAFDQPMIKVKPKSDRPKRSGKRKRGRKRGRGKKSRRGKGKKSRKQRKHKPKAAVLQGDDPGVNSILFKICAKYNKINGTGMAIIDVGVLTGFSAVEQSLKDLKKRANPGISRYEISDRHIILYVDKIPGTHSLCFPLEMRRDFEIGLVQPVPVVVYDYYEPDNKCTKFYGPDPNSQLNLAICDENSCKCMMDKCPPCNAKVTVKKYCDKYDYAFKGKVRSIDEQNKWLQIKIDVEEIYKNTNNMFQKNGRLIFRKQTTCGCPIVTADTVDSEFIFMGMEQGLKRRNGGTLTAVIDNTMLAHKWIPEYNKFKKAIAAPNACG